MIPIAGQWFTLGSNEGRDDERPEHRVWVDPFEIAATQVTNAEYKAFAQPSSPFNDPDQPVVAVSWFDAVRYCEWLSGKSGRRFRLPTEAEWECAARGGLEGKLYPWGDEPRADSTRYENGPERCGTGTPNAYGLYEMCENVHEWCSDWYAADYYRVSPEKNPRGPETGVRRASRGGSWRHQIKISRCAARSSLPPALQYLDYGFRVACDA